MRGGVPRRPEHATDGGDRSGPREDQVERTNIERARELKAALSDAKAAEQKRAGNLNETGAAASRA